MWENSKDVTNVYSTHGSQQFWAILSGLPGWKMVKAGSPDGVANVAQVLTTAKFHGRKVNVYIVSDQIERAVML